MKWSLSYTEAFHQWIFSAIVRYIPGKIWGVGTRIFMAKKSGIAVEHSTIALTLETVIEVISSVLFISVVWFLTGNYALTVLWLLLFLCAGLFIAPPFFKYIVQKIIRFSLKKEIEIPYSSKGLFFFLVSFLILQCLFWASSLLLFSPPSLRLTFVFSWTAAGMAGFLTGLGVLIVPAGLGVRELGLATLWSAWMPFEKAMTIGMAVRMAQITGETLVFILALLISFLHRNKKIQDHEMGHSCFEPNRKITSKTEKLIALRFDADSITCVRRGMPNLIGLAKKYGIPMTFFVCMGQSFFWKSFQRKKHETHCGKYRKIHPLKKMGIIDTLHTLVWNPQIGIRYEDVFCHALQQGHELGLHGGRNHGWWQINAVNATEEKLWEDLSWGHDEFTKRFGKPFGFAAPGFVWNSAVLDMIEKKSFAYASDMEGECPFQPVIEGRQYHHWQIPVTICGPQKISYLEWCQMQGKSDQEITDGFSQLFGKHPYEVIYGHPFREGIHGLTFLERVIRLALDQGYQFKRMKELVPAPSQPSACQGLS